MGESINFEDLFNWQLASDRHYLTMLHRLNKNMNGNYWKNKKETNVFLH